MSYCKVYLSKNKLDIISKMLNHLVKLYEEEKTPFGEHKNKRNNINTIKEYSEILKNAEELK